MNNLKNFLATLAMNPSKKGGRRQQIWDRIILPASTEFEGMNPNRTGIYLQATFFRGGTTICSTICSQLGNIHPKNVFFAAEKTWRLWQYNGNFASESADLLRDSYTGLEWAELKAIKFGGAIKIRHKKSDDTAILAVSGLHPYMDEASAYGFAQTFKELDDLVLLPCINNPAIDHTLTVFNENRNLFKL